MKKPEECAKLLGFTEWEGVTEQNRNKQRFEVKAFLNTDGSVFFFCLFCFSFFFFSISHELNL